MTGRELAAGHGAMPENRTSNQSHTAVRVNPAPQSLQVRGGCL